jgi:hypothetical protein
MPQRNFKTLAVWDTSYDALEKIRQEENTTFNQIIYKLLDMYYTAEMQEPLDHE